MNMYAYLFVKVLPYSKQQIRYLQTLQLLQHSCLTCRLTQARQLWCSVLFGLLSRCKVCFSI
jgi:hypothetical protein